ncbi:hypothetical protein BC332_33230 [Capsicum chinense]|nr:hypothetical protein BC332_33230 [Capsicum chinense]
MPYSIQTIKWLRPNDTSTIVIVDQYVKNSCSGMMASGEGSSRASREVTMDALLAVIMSVKHDLSGRMERMEERMDGIEGSFSRRMDTLEVRLDSKHSSPKHYHASTSGHATTPDIFSQLLNPPRPTHEPIHQVPTYPKNRSQVHQETFQIRDPLDMPRAPLNQNQPIQIDDMEGGGLYGGEGLDEGTLFAEFMRNRRRAYGGRHRGRGGRVRPAPHGRGNLGHRPHVQEGIVDQGGNMGRDTDLNSIKITLPSFKGTSDPSLYLDWELQCNRIFQLNELTSQKKAAYVIAPAYTIAQFEGYASTWWETKRLQRARNDNLDLSDWDELKALMRERYVTKRYK